MHNSIRGFFLGFLLAFGFPTFADTCMSPQGGWVLYNSSPYADYLPDTNTTYWRYIFDGSRLGDTVLKITGEFAAADYLNYTVYDQEEIKTDPAQSLTDNKIVAEPGLDANGKKHYVIWMATKESILRKHLGAGYDKANKLMLPDSRRHFYDLFYRLYAPHDLTSIAGRNGGVPLPTIEAFHVGGASQTCPPVKNAGIPLSDSTTDLPPDLVTPAIPFTRYDPDKTGIYGRHHDNLYLLARLNFDFGKLAYFKVKTPSLQEARYYSICVSGASGRTSECTYDKFVVKDANGYAHFVVGPESVKAQVQALGFNFIPRGQLVVPIIMYRILEPTEAFRSVVTQIPSAAQMLKGTTAGFDSVWNPTGSHYVDVAALAKAVPAPAANATFHELVREEWPVEIAPFDRQHLRVGLSWDYLVPRTAAGLVYPHPRTAREHEVFFRTQMSFLTRMMKNSFDRLFRTGPKQWGDHTCEVRPPDILANQLTAGSLDLGIMTGTTFVRLRPYFPNLKPLFSLNTYKATPPENKSLFVVLPQNSVLANLGELKSHRFLYYDSMDADAFLYLSQLYWQQGVKNLDGLFELEKTDDADSTLTAIAIADANGDFDLLDGKDAPPFTVVTGRTLAAWAAMHPISEKNYHFAVIDLNKLKQVGTADFDGDILSPVTSEAALHQLEAQNPLPVPASVVVYDSNKVDAAKAAELLASYDPNLLNPNPMANLGLGEVQPVTDKYLNELNRFQANMGERAEYFLPFVKFKEKTKHDAK